MEKIANVYHGIGVYLDKDTLLYYNERHLLPVSSFVSHFVACFIKYIQIAFDSPSVQTYLLSMFLRPTLMVWTYQVM